RHLVDPLQTILHSFKPTIAQVEGWCIGGGMYISLCCDITIAAENAKISHRENRLAFAGNVFVLPIEILLIGQKKARELYLTGETISGKEAERIGLINKAVPRAKLWEEAKRYAKAISLNSRDAIAIGKAFTQGCYDMLGMTTGLTYGYIGHSFATNLRFEPDEYNFIKQREKKGAKAAFHGLHDRFKQLGFE
ncbi:MAG: enoyl-CoA hydratase/isomerase family protein, partial [Candidatus Bathyarchaeia archaeon]